MKKRFWALRDKYLPALLITLFAAIAADGQVYQRNLTGYGNQGRRLAADSTINIPTGCGAPTTTQEHGMQGEMRMAKLFYDSCNAKFYIYNPSTSTWNTAATGSGAGISEIIAGYGLLTVNDSTQKVDSSLIATKLYALHLKDSILANIPAVGPPGIGQVVGTNGLSTVNDSTLAIDFKDSLTVKAYQEKKIWAWWGDSMTELPAGGSSTTATQSLLGYQIFNKGISGNTSTEIRTRFEVEPGLRKYATIIWSGANNFANKTTVVQDIQSMVANLGHQNYVVIGVTKTTLQTVGTSTSDQVDALNDTLRQVFGVHFKDANDYFVNVVPALTSQDNTDRANEIPLSSYRSDNQHLNRLGTIYMSYFIRDSCLAQLAPASIDGAVIGDDIFEAYQNKSSISSVGSLRAVNHSAESGLDITSVGGYAYRWPEKLTNNLMTSDLSGWTATDWTWANPGATHTTGNTSVLSQNITGVLVGQLYQIEFTIASSAGTVDVDFGTVKVFDPVSITNGSFKKLVLAPSSATQLFKFTPTSTFNGTITNVSVRLVRTEREATIAVRDTANNILFQLRAYPNDYFTIGKYNGIFNQSTSKSVVIGDYAGRELANATGMAIYGYAAGQRNNNSSYGSLYGYQSGREFRESLWYAGFGANSLFSATIAKYVSGFGGRALESLTQGDANTGSGYYVLGRYTTGASNTANGFQSGAYGTTGSNNTYDGRDAGYVPDGATNGYYEGSNGTFIGARIRPWSRTQNNQLAIGIYDRRLIGYDGLQHFKFNALNYDDNNIATNVSFDFQSITGGLRPPYMTETQRNAISTPGHASVIFNLTANQFNWYDSIATTWQVGLGSGSGSGTNNANAGSGFRFLKPASQQIKTLFGGYGLTIDSTSNTDGITIALDTATVFDAVRATIPAGSGSANLANTDLTQTAEPRIFDHNGLDFQWTDNGETRWYGYGGYSSERIMIVDGKVGRWYGGRIGTGVYFEAGDSLYARGVAASADTANKYVLVETSNDGIQKVRAGAFGGGGSSDGWLRAVVTTDFTLSDVNTAQTAFPSAIDQVTLESDATYYFEFGFDMSTGTTSHGAGMGFDLGSVTTNYVNYQVMGYAAAENNQGSIQATSWRTNTTPVNNMMAASTVAGNHLKGWGYISVNSGGAITPQIIFSAAPGGTNLMKAGSYIHFRKVGDGSFTTNSGFN
jgi:hypothetical protein